MRLKITRLSAQNVLALDAAHSLVDGEVTWTASTATFGMDDPKAWVGCAREALATRYGRRGHPYQSFHTVVRKVEAAIAEQAEAPQGDEPGPAVLNQFLEL